MGWWPFAVKCPVDVETREWVVERMNWLVGQFGLGVLRNARAVVPTDEFFPDAYDQSEASVRRMLDRVCVLMGVDPETVRLRLFQGKQRLSAGMGVNLKDEGKHAAGTYHADGGHVVSIEMENLKEPEALVATMAHELAHVRLLGEGRVTGEEEDHEPLTDLATVFFGFGVFNANSVMRFNQWTRGNMQGWKAATLGYLDERTFGFAIGLWTLVRDEEKPRWFRQLRLGPRDVAKKSIRWLKAQGELPVPARRRS